jgi:hypothetical protein
MEENDLEELVLALEEYKEKAEVLGHEANLRQLAMSKLEDELNDSRRRESESLQLIEELEQSICILDKELQHANDCLSEAEQDRFVSKRKSLYDTKLNTGIGPELEDDDESSVAEKADLRRQVAQLTEKYEDIIRKNKELTFAVTSKDDDIQGLFDEIDKLKCVIDIKDTELERMSRQLSCLHAKEISGGRPTVQDKGDSAGASACTLDARGHGQSTSMPEYPQWSKSYSEQQDLPRNRTQASPAGILSDKKSDSQPDGLRTPLSNTTPTRNYAFHARTTSESTASSRLPIKKAMPDLSPPAALDLSHIHLTPTRHSFTAASPSTASSSSFSSPHHSSANPAHAVRRSSKSALYDSDTDEQTSPLQIRRRQQSRSLNSFDELFRHAPHNQTLFSAGSEGDMLRKSPKSNQTREGDFSGSGRDEPTGRQTGSLFYRLSTSSQKAPLPKQVPSSSSRWASIRSENYSDAPDDQPTRQLSEDKADDELACDRRVDVKIHISTAKINRGALMLSGDGSSNLSTINDGHKKQLTSGEVGVTKSSMGSSSSLSSLVPGKSKRTVIPMGVTQTTI